MSAEEVQKKLWECWAWVIFVGGHWVVLSAVLNIALRLKKAEQWVEAAEQVPLLATGIRWLRGLGVDPAAALRGGATVASATSSQVCSIKRTPASWRSCSVFSRFSWVKNTRMRK